MTPGVHSTVASKRVPILRRLIRRLRPRDGYLILGLAWSATITLPLAALLGGLIAGLEPLPWLTTLGLLLAWWLAGRRLRGWAASTLLVACGALATLWWGVHVLQPGLLLSQSGRWLLWWAGNQPGPAPEVTAFAAQAGDLVGFAQRVARWTGGLATGRGFPDNLVALALACLIGWLAAAWAGWRLARDGDVTGALLPTGALLLLQVYWTSRSAWLILVFLAATTFLLVLVPLSRRMHAWERDGTDYSPEIRLDAGAAALAIAGLVLVLSPSLPFLTSRQVSDAFWRLFREPYRRFEEQAGRAFEPLRTARSLIPPEGVTPGGMPRAHLLGGQPELGREVALRVRLQGAAPVEALRWRGQTFAYYTGRGWEEDPEGVVQVDLAAGQRWLEEGPPASRLPVLAFVNAAPGLRSAAYAPGEPIAMDRPYRVTIRAPGELVAMQARPPADRYGVLGAVAVRDAAALRGTVTQYPPVVAAPYLQLPAGLPAELRDYAAELGGEASALTPYERALAIEAALREMPYSLDVPPPPPEQDVVAWFLFDLRRGYCDYFATAMVVLARLNGIPARLAVGYLGGNYDEDSGQYIVTELNAHSWPELFFPGYGWIPFEPTPAAPLPALAAAPGALPPYLGEPLLPNLDAGLEALRTSADARTASERGQRWLQGLLALANAATAVCLAMVLVRRTEATPIADVPGAPARLLRQLTRWGARLGRPPWPGDTLREYALALGSIAADTARLARLSPSSARRAACLLERDLPRLVNTLEAAIYSPEGTLAEAVSGRPWRDLWAALRRLWLARRRL